MEIFIVGGAVRDMILGKAPKDVDLLVVGATEKEFTDLLPGAKKVGKHFPVFIFNEEEYALARTEKSTGDGHKDFSVDFSPSITLEQDLLRRDLTVNSLAMCPANNSITGNDKAISDISRKILRHNSDKAFKEDPLRVFRVARFSAQLDGFTVASETLQLMRSMKDELLSLPAERVFSEMRKALCGKKPAAFFEVLKEADCLGWWFPELESLIGIPAGPDSGKHKGERDCFEHTMNVISGIDSDNPAHLFAGLCHDLGKSLSDEPPKHHGHDKEGVVLVETICQRLRVPNAFKVAAKIFCLEHIRMHLIQEMRPAKAILLVAKAFKVMPGGIKGFLACSVGDGMTEQQAKQVESIADEVLKVRIPSKDHGRGKACADILLQMQVAKWKELS